MEGCAKELKNIVLAYSQPLRHCADTAFQASDSITVEGALDPPRGLDRAKKHGLEGKRFVVAPERFLNTDLDFLCCEQMVLGTA